MGTAQTRTIAPRGKLRIADQKFFLHPGSSLKQGYVEIASDGVSLAGSVVFGDPAGERFASALPEGLPAEQIRCFRPARFE